MLKRPPRLWLFALAAMLCGCTTAQPAVIQAPMMEAGTEAFQGVELPPTWTPTASSTPSPTRPTHTAPPPTITRTAKPSLGPAEEAAAWTPRPLPTIPTVQYVTSVPAATDFTGWQRVETALAAFMLPDTYEVIDLGSGFSEFFGEFAEGFVEGMGEFANQFAGELDLTPTPFSVEGLDEAFTFDFIVALGPDLQTGVVLVSEPMDSIPKLEQQMRAALGSMEGDLTVLSWQVLEDTAIPTGRIVIEADDSQTGLTGRALMYIFLGRDQVWSLIYQTPASAFQANLPLFEKSASSFQIK
ncbi:MAG: hypothetical protein P8X64_06830 [Anaerolineales bacterium]